MVPVLLAADFANKSREEGILLPFYADHLEAV